MTLDHHTDKKYITLHKEFKKLSKDKKDYYFNLADGRFQIAVEQFFYNDFYSEDVDIIDDVLYQQNKHYDFIRNILNN